MNVFTRSKFNFVRKKDWMELSNSMGRTRKDLTVAIFWHLPSIRVTDVPAEIHIENLQSAVQEYYRLNHPALKLIVTMKMESREISVSLSHSQAPQLLPARDGYCGV
jgi:hypothetical protein